MTVKINQLTLPEVSDPSVWARRAPDSRYDEFDVVRICNDNDRLTIPQQVILSAVRYVMRTYKCDRIPEVVGVYGYTTRDQYDNDLYAEVEYCRYYRTMLGGHFNGDETVTWTVYMD